MLRMMQRSSAQEAMCGNSSLTGMPLSPWRVNFQGLGMMLPTSLNIVGLTGTGMGLPASRSKSGFGSNESTCETPPDMKQKITLFALGVKCGLRPAPGRSELRAIDPKPVEHCASICRREIGDVALISGK